MKQQKFFVGDVVKRTDWITTHKAAKGDPITVTSVEYDEEQDVWWLGFYGDPAEWEDTCYTIVERAWQENTGVQPVPDDVIVEFQYADDVCLSNPLPRCAKLVDWADNGSIIRWRIADEYEEQPADAVCPPDSIPPAHVALGEEVVAVDVQKKNKYTREIKPNVFVDVYDVLRAFEVTDPCLSHLVKKALCAGLRGHKNRLTDLQDIKASIERAIEMHIEWEK